MVSDSGATSVFGSRLEAIAKGGHADYASSNGRAGGSSR